MESELERTQTRFRLDSPPPYTSYPEELHRQGHAHVLRRLFRLQSRLSSFFGAPLLILPIFKLDYSAGFIPVTFVDKIVDSLPGDFTSSSEYIHMNDISRDIHNLYDADAMNGLPVGIEVIGRRLEEEKVLAGVKVVKDALAASGTVFTPKKF